VGFDEFGNPIYIGGSVNMARRKRRYTRRNPLEVKALQREWLQGINLMDAGAAAGGLAATTILPGMLVRTTVTTWEKILKLGASLGVAIAAGFVGRNIDASVGKAALMGGIAGTTIQAIGMVTGVQIGEPRRLTAGRRPLGTSTVVSPGVTRQEETVSLITP